MLDRIAPNPRERVGGNNPPGALELTKPIIEELGRFLADHPVVSNESEAREAKAIADRVFLALKSVEEERDSQVRPLNERVAAINAEYHHWFSTNDKKPGLWGTLLRELKVRLTAFARAEEAKRIAAAEAARRAAEEAAETARRAAEAEAQARDEAAMGICDVDLAGAVEDAKATSDAAMRADRNAQRAEHDSKVRIGGGFSKVSTLRTVEILTVTDWRAAIEDMIGSDGTPPTVIIDAILTAARAYRRENHELPAGVAASHERRI